MTGRGRASSIRFMPRTHAIHLIQSLAGHIWKQLRRSMKRTRRNLQEWPCATSDTAFSTSNQEDQFMKFWLALEIIAENVKARDRVPIACPACNAALKC